MRKNKNSAMRTRTRTRHRKGRSHCPKLQVSKTPKGHRTPFDRDRAICLLRQRTSPSGLELALARFDGEVVTAWKALKTKPESRRYVIAAALVVGRLLPDGPRNLIMRRVLLQERTSDCARNRYPAFLTNDEEKEKRQKAKRVNKTRQRGTRCRYASFTVFVKALRGMHAPRLGAHTSWWSQN